MIAKVRIWVKDTAKQQWTDDQVKAVLQEAWGSVVLQLLSDPLGKQALFLSSAAGAFVVNQEEYSLPADCLRLVSVEVLGTDSNARWQPLVLKAPDDESGAFLSGNAQLFGQARGVPVSGWYARDVARGKVRLWPSPKAATSATWRVRYYHRPAFPAQNSGAFAGIPEGADSLCEFWAAALLSFEELEDGKPIGAMGKLYSGKFAEYCQAAEPVEAPRRYVHLMS
jgi:hypothetical protein